MIDDIRIRGCGHSKTTVTHTVPASSELPPVKKVSYVPVATKSLFVICPFSIHQLYFLVFLPNDLYSVGYQVKRSKKINLSFKTWLFSREKRSV